MQRVQENPLIITLKKLTGNPRISILTEPLWGIPYNLFLPYASIYMLALGISDAQIGLIASLGMLAQPVFALFSGAITDKYGRRLTTLIADIVSWSIPTIIWAVAQDIRYFAVAAIINSAWRISHNAWTCLLVEDADEEDLVHVWTWIYIAVSTSAFFVPLAGLLIGAIDLVPGVRLLYLLASVMMTLKAVLLYRFSTETQQGYVRMAETKDQPLLSLLNGYGEVLKQILRTPQTMISMAILFVMGIAMLINGTFWSILVTEKLGIPAEQLAIYPFAKSAFLLILYFVLVPRINLRRFRNPLLIGFAGFIVSNLILVLMPARNYWLLLLSVLIDAFSTALYGPLMDSLVIVSIDAKERARISSIMAVLVLLLTSPFGWIAGQLSEANRVYPFILSSGFFVVGFVLVLVAWRFRKDPSNIPAASTT